VPWLKCQPTKLVSILYFNHGSNIKIFLCVKLEAFYWCCVDFASKFSPFNNSPIAKYIPFAMDMLLVILIKFWLLSLLCKHLQFLSHHHGHYSIKKSPNHLHLTQILASYAIPYMSYVATLATSHTWKKKVVCGSYYCVFTKKDDWKLVVLRFKGNCHDIP
jgi:hypothetical protein